MLHRSCNLRTFVRQNVVCHYTDRRYIFEIGRAKRFASLFISSRSNCRYNGNVILGWLRPESHSKANLVGYSNPRWRYIDASNFSTKSEESRNDIQNDKKTARSEADQKILKAAVTEKIIELNAEKLGKIKERPLDTSVAEQTTKVSKLKPEKLIEKIKEAVSAEATIEKPVVGEYTIL